MRAVKVKVGSTQKMRPIHKLVRLEASTSCDATQDININEDETEDEESEDQRQCEDSRRERRERR